MKVRNCLLCPCSNNDYEQGYDCNLGFTQRMFTTDDSKDCFTGSCDCGLSELWVARDDGCVDLTLTSLRMIDAEPYVAPPLSESQQLSIDMWTDYICATLNKPDSIVGWKKKLNKGTFKISSEPNIGENNLKT